MKSISHTHSLRTQPFWIALAIAVVLWTAPQAFAQEEAQVQVREVRTEARTEARNARQARIGEQVQARIIHLSENVINRVTAALDRLENIASRINSRMDTLAANGVDVSAAEARLTDAENAIQEARNLISSLGTVSTAISSDNPREAFGEIRAQFTLIKEALHEARRALIDTVALLKEAVLEARADRGASSAVTDAPSDSE